MDKTSKQIVLPPADGAAHDGPAAQRAGKLLRRLAPRRKAAEQIHLAVVHDDLASLFPIVFLKLSGDGLNNGNQHELNCTQDYGPQEKWRPRLVDRLKSKDVP